MGKNTVDEPTAVGRPTDGWLVLFFVIFIGVNFVRKKRKITRVVRMYNMYKCMCVCVEITLRENTLFPFCVILQLRIKY